MSIASIGALSTVLGVANFAANKISRVDKAIPAEISKNTLTDTTTSGNSRLPEVKRFDRVEFNAQEIQTANLPPSDKFNSLQNAQDAVEAADVPEAFDTVDTIETQAQTMEQPEMAAATVTRNEETPFGNLSQNGGNDSDEPQDFKAVRLIKASEIPMPEPPSVEERRETAKLDQAQELERLEKAQIEESLAETDTTNSVEVQAANAGQVAGAPQANQAGQANIAQANTEPAVNLAERSAMRMRDENRISYNDYSTRLDEAARERAEESPTMTNSAEIAARDTQKLTPSQSKGIEIYRQFQSYVNPINISNAASIA